MKPITEEELIDYLTGELTATRQAEVAAQLESDPKLKRELDELRWLQTEVSCQPDPKPSAAADARFAALLTKPAPRRRSLHQRPAALLAMAATLLFLVFGLGWHFGRGATEEVKDELAATRSLMLELMRDTESSNRMRAATVTLDVEVADPQLIANLGLLLRTDANANVRLAALDALQRFADTPEARQEMLDAMDGNPPPAVQIQLMETLIGLNEERVLPYLEQIITNDSIPRPLRDAAQLGTFKLI